MPNIQLINCFKFNVIQCKRFLYDAFEGPHQLEVVKSGALSFEKKKLDDDQQRQNKEAEDKFKKDFKEKIQNEKLSLLYNKNNTDYLYEFEVKPNKVRITRINLTEKKERGTTSPVINEVSYNDLFANNVSGMPELESVIDQNKTSLEKLDNLEIEARLNKKLGDLMSSYESMDPLIFSDKFRSAAELWSTVCNELDSYAGSLSPVKGMKPVDIQRPDLNLRIVVWDNGRHFKNVNNGWANNLFLSQKYRFEKADEFAEYQKPLKRIGDYMNDNERKYLGKYVANGRIGSMKAFTASVDELFNTVIQKTSFKKPAKNISFDICIGDVPFKISFNANNTVSWTGNYEALARYVFQLHVPSSKITPFGKEMLMINSDLFEKGVEEIVSNDNTYLKMTTEKNENEASELKRKVSPRLRGSK